MMIETSFEALGVSAAIPAAEIAVGVAVVAGVVALFVASKLFSDYSNLVHRRWKLFQFR